MKETVYLGIGSNMGDRLVNIAYAFKGLREVIPDLKSASVYETEPMYMTDQPLFLNTVFTGTTELSPDELLGYIHHMEDSSGRNREEAGWKGPRPLDIDILLYGSRQIFTPDLTVPHPGIRERDFVLAPLTELSPDCTDPATGEKYINFLRKKPVSLCLSSELSDILLRNEQC